jgi:hypothetical protein
VSSIAGDSFIKTALRARLSQCWSVGPAEWIMSRPVNRSTFGTSTLDASAVRLEMMIEATSRSRRTVTLDGVDALGVVIIGL